MEDANDSISMHDEPMFLIVCDLLVGKNEKNIWDMRYFRDEAILEAPNKIGRQTRCLFLKMHGDSSREMSPLKAQMNALAESPLCILLIQVVYWND